MITKIKELINLKKGKLISLQKKKKYIIKKIQIKTKAKPRVRVKVIVKI